MALYHFSAKVLSHSTRNTVGAVAYRAGCQLSDVRTGEDFDYANKAVQHVELVVPKDAPQWMKDIQDLIKADRQEGVQALTQLVEAAEYRINSQVWREIEVALHRELTNEQSIALAREFAEDQLCGRGMTALLNFHFDVDKKTKEAKPHCHILLTMRTLEEEGFSPKKERSWNTKAFIQELREQWAHYSNFHLKLHGHDVQIDHRSNQERGIEMEPQPKCGKNVLEQERKAVEKKGASNTVESVESVKFDKIPPVTEIMQAFHDAQLRNLYRIIRNPDVILDIVSKHHSTFMWADVQKKLHQYVDNAPLFERLEAKLKRSNELVVLRMETVRDSSGTEHNKAIYTTRSMLKAEKSLIEQAEKLGNSQTHGVQEVHIERAIAKTNEELKKHGGLSQDQIKAIHHLVEEGQIKCVVGIAGAGKTTAIGVCHDIWSAEGYAVYGLAPTGKAAQNLEGSSLESNGIPSTTLHRFLKSFEEGRCQYNDKSILVLDEAGMVDVDRFEKLLSAVRQLGVKLIVVGDGAQLQPVEAGPAFRLVTEKLGRSELNTVIRQKEEWQKEATVLFGQQKTSEAIKKYEEKECVHIIEEKLPSLEDAIHNKDYNGIVHLYEASHRVSSLIYREMAKDVQRDYPELKNLYPKIKEHEDFGRYLDWKDVEKGAADGILQNARMCRPILEARAVDTLKLALVFKDNKKDKFDQQESAKAVLKECGLDHLIGIEKQRGQSVDVRQTAKEELIHAWHTAFKACAPTFSGAGSRAQDPGGNPDKSLAILAFSNRDVNDLNRQVRSLLKQSGHLSKGEFTFKIRREIEDDFGRKYILQEEKGFSKGDRIVFTKNKYWLGVKNGTMGTITEINNQKIQVKLDEGTKFSGKEISVAPNLNPYFDHGWAVTIHKSQGTTVDQTYVLASFEMNQNLAYVAMTRHREGVKLFGSSLDFWRTEKLPELLSKSGEKLSAADYLDTDALTKIMKRDDHLITKFFQRMSNELEAMGAVTKQAFWNVADHFLGIKREKEIRVLQDGVREEVRAEELFKKESPILDVAKGAASSHSLQVQAQSQHQLISRDGSQAVQQTTQSKDEKLFSSSPSPALIEGGNSFLKPSEKAIQQKFVSQKSHKKQIVENALKANMADFADHVFASIGAQHNRAMSSSIERRYGKKGEFSVNLEKGVWLSHKDSQLAGTPLHLLTQLKNLSPKEAVDYGASWARLSPDQLVAQKQSYGSSHVQKEALERAKKTEEIKQKIERAQSFWSKGQAIQGTLAERYLREHRKIEGNLPKDLLYLPAHGKGNASLSCLMAAARSPEGEVTAVQLIFLDPTTANKAQIPVPKRSFGSLTGSAVTIQACPLESGKPMENSNLHFIAEGVETALSLKEAGIKGTIKASLGLSNIKNLEPQDPKTRIIICADHDAPDSSATKSLEKSAYDLQEKGFKVTVIKPDTLGEDFNDVLKTKGPESIKDIFAKNLPKHFYAFMQNHIETLPQKDFHGSKDIEKKDEKQSLENVKGPQEFTLEGKTYKEIVAHCVKRLHDALARDKQPLTQEHIQRFPVQAERTATFLLHFYEKNERHPTQEEFIQFSLRAKYELSRIPEIRKQLIKDWKEKDSFKENEGLRAHMIAERLASIEGRLYLKAKLDGTKVPSNIDELAHQELKVLIGVQK